MAERSEELKARQRATLARGLKSRWGNATRGASRQIRLDAAALDAFEQCVPESRRREVATAAIWRIVADFGGSVPPSSPEKK